MKLRIAKYCVLIISVVGILGFFIGTFAGEIMKGWIFFIAALLISGLINLIFFRCPECGNYIPANATINQKYCPICGADLGLNESHFSYYSKCRRTKKGTYRTYTTVGFLGFAVSTVIAIVVVIALFGVSEILKSTGLLIIGAAVLLGGVIGFLCRWIVGSAAKMDNEYLYFSKRPGKWEKYKFTDIKECAKTYKPFYHVVRGYVMVTSKGVIIVPVASYIGGKEFFEILLEKIGEPMVEVKPENVASKRDEEGKRAEQEYKRYKESIKEKVEE